MGSSSRSRSGWDSSSLHNATRRRSPAGQHGHIGIGGRAAQRVHRLLKLAVQVPRIAVIKLLLEPAHLFQQLVGVVRRHLLGDLVVLVQQGLGLRHPVLDVAQHGLGLIKPRLLAEQPHREAGKKPRIAVGRMLQARHHLQQRRLARTVGPDHTDLRPGEKRQRHVVEYDLAFVRLPDTIKCQDPLYAGCTRKGRPGQTVHLMLLLRYGWLRQLAVHDRSSHAPTAPPRETRSECASACLTAGPAAAAHRRRCR